MENQQNVTTLGDIFHIIRKHIWIVIIVTLACALVFFCFVQFYYNNTRQNFIAKYYISFPGLKSGSAQSVYPDGTVFRIQDVVSYDVLDQIKQDVDGKFDSVDILQLIEDDAITITQSDTTSAVQTEAGADVSVTLSVSASYFSDSKQAQDFIMALASYPVTHAQQLVANASYETYLDNYRDSDVNTYEEKIDFLVLQQKYLLDMYDSIIEAKGAYYTVSYQDENGNTITGTLDSYRSRCDAVFNEKIQSSIWDELEAKSYIYDYDYYQSEATSRKEILQSKINNLEIQIESYNRIIQDLQGSGGNSDLISNIISKASQLAEEKTLCEVELKQIEDNLQLSEEEVAERNKAFDAKLDNYANQIRQQTQIFKKVRMEYFAQESYFSMQSNKLAITGGVSPVVAILGGMIVGFIAASIVVCIIDLSKLKKNKAAIASTQENAEPLSETKKDDAEF